MSDSGSTAAIRALAESKRLPAVILERWLAMQPESREAILAAARDLRMRTAQIAVAIETLEEISVREDVSPAAILNRAELRRIIAGPGAAPARAGKLLDALRTIRYPRLSAALARLRAEIRALKLPATIAIAVPKDLASDELTISLKIRSADELERALEALADKSTELRRIIDLLGGR
ncbi:MAG: hypothetical protein ACREQI_16290 [Candidatus Binataceae bacterium]